MRLSTFMYWSAENCCSRCWGNWPDDWQKYKMVQVVPNGMLHLWDTGPLTRCNRPMRVKSFRTGIY